MSITKAATVSAEDKPPFGSQQQLRRRHTRWHVYAVAACVGALVFGAGILLDWWLLPGRRPVLYSDGFTAIVAGVLAFIALRHYDTRRHELSVRLAVVAEVNHHGSDAESACATRPGADGDHQLSGEANRLGISRCAAARPYGALGLLYELQTD